MEYCPCPTQTKNDPSTRGLNPVGLVISQTSLPMTHLRAQLVCTTMICPSRAPLQGSPAALLRSVTESRLAANAIFLWWDLCLARYALCRPHFGFSQDFLLSRENLTLLISTRFRLKHNDHSNAWHDVQTSPGCSAVPCKESRL